MTHLIFTYTVFAAFAAVALFSAVLVVTLNNPVRCVLFLVLAFVSTAGMWLMAHAEFLALILILVYVGAVMTLFLFVVMMINVDVAAMKYQLLRYFPFGILIVALLVSLTLTAIAPEHFVANAPVANNISNTQQLGLVLYTHYAYALELAAVLLLIAIIAAIVLVHRAPRHAKQQQIVQQILVNSKDRIRLVSMKK